MTKRAFRCHLAYGLKRSWRIPLEWLYRFAVRKGIKDYYGGIALADVNGDDGDDQDFIERTKEALELIRQADPRRFHMIEREVKIIVNGELISGGQYIRGARSCEIDFWRYKLVREAEDYEWRLARYASTIVHEAVHGRLHSLHIPYTRATRGRSERICRMEQRRFAARLKSERYNFARDLVPPYREADWHPLWYASIWKRTKALLERVKQSREWSAVFRYTRKRNG